jgi:hypothetical protein
VKRKLKIIVSGMVAGNPGQGGATWAVLQYVLGFGQLGHEVCLVEPVQPNAVRPAGATLADSENAAYFRKVTTAFGLEDRAALLLAGTTDTFGMSYETLKTLARSTDLLLNISGMLTDDELTQSIPARVYLDLDPAFNQLWHAVEGIDMRFDGHTHFVTVGQAIGEPGCRIPDCGRKWLKTFPPVVLEHWPVANNIRHDALTTIANWRGYGSIQHQGQHYGQKAHSLRPFMHLPTLTKEKFVLALAIHPSEARDLETLNSNGWQFLDPVQVAGCPATYQTFIQQSKGELGIAKSGYVVSRSAWFSDRSVCYLASGRPVIAQDTGFSRHLPTGAGLFAFQNTDQILEAIGQLRRDYPKQAGSARAIAEEYFDSRKVLNRLLDQTSG